MRLITASSLTPKITVIGESFNLWLCYFPHYHKVCFAFQPMILPKFIGKIVLELEHIDGEPCITLNMPTICRF